MEERAARHLSDRDLRTLPTDDLLALIRRDIAELDQLILTRKAADREARKPTRRATIREAMEALPPDEPEGPPPDPFHAVTCCNHHMGDFPPIARVRCPFCGQWHRAGDFPEIC
jgi:hypothetical protein